MFWNKNKKQIPQETQKCNVDQNLTECLSVSNLRKYQQELKELEYLNIPYLIAKYFNTLNCPSCGSVLNNDHFDRIVCEFELQAKWLERLR